MELSKQDTQKAKGVAILGMVMLHLFCRLGDLPYTPWIWIGETPLVYYLGLFGDICVPIYCFCSGYAHYLLKEKHGNQYRQTILRKLLSFLINYWIAVILFCVIGWLFENGNTIPGSASEFLGNVFLYQISYNGAWWFVVTYVFLTILSPLLIKVTNRMHPAILTGLSGAAYFVAYIFRFNIQLAIQNPVLDWVWQQLILLGTSQFGYILGMVCRKEKWVSKLRLLVSSENNCTEATVTHRWITKVTVRLLPVIAFVCHCFVQSLIVAPLTAGTVLACMFLEGSPSSIDRFLLFMGKHSTNIWLGHMFFYLILFENLAYAAKYPVFIFIFMIFLCLCASWVINLLYQSVAKYVRVK